MTGVGQPPAFLKVSRCKNFDDARPQRRSRKRDVPSLELPVAERKIGLICYNHQELRAPQRLHSLLKPQPQRRPTANL